MLDTRFTPETLLAAKTRLQEMLRVFPDGTTTKPVPGCQVTFNITCEHDELAAHGIVASAAAEKFKATSNFFSFRPAKDGAGMIFYRRIMFNEQVDAMHTAVYDLVYRQLRVFIEE